MRKKWPARALSAQAAAHPVAGGGPAPPEGGARSGAQITRPRSASPTALALRCGGEVAMMHGSDIDSERMLIRVEMGSV
jgi:hypothetical protein